MMKTIPKPSANQTLSIEISLKEAFFTWLKISLLSFGGPAGQIALMHRILVEEKRWISEERFLHALNYCMLLPGPEAQQLAIYLGWLLHRTLGGVIAGVLFILPGAIVVLLLSILYAGYQESSVVDAFFYGIKAAVLAVIVVAVIRIGSKVLKNNIMLATSVVSFIALYFFSTPFPIVIICAALVGFFGGKLYPSNFEIIKAKAINANNTEGLAVIDLLIKQNNNQPLAHTKPSINRAFKVIAICLLLWIVPIILMSLLLSPTSVYTEEGVFFSKMAVVTFGGAYAVLSYVAQQAVTTFGWLNPGEMLDGLGMAETTPGPLIMVVQFVGFMGAFRNPGNLDPMLAGTLGALITTWVTFVPCFLWIFLGSPFIEAMRSKQHFSAALSVITAAVVGVIVNLALWFSLHVLFSKIDRINISSLSIQVPQLNSIDLASLIIAVVAFIAMQKYKMGMIKVLFISALFGMGGYYLAN